MFVALFDLGLGDGQLPLQLRLSDAVFHLQALFFGGEAGQCLFEFLFRDAVFERQLFPLQLEVGEWAGVAEGEPEAASDGTGAGGVAGEAGG